MGLGVGHRFHMAIYLGGDHPCLTRNIPANHEHYTKFPNGMSEAENGGREEAGLSQGQGDGNK